LLKCDISPDMLNVAMVLGNAEAIEMAVEEGLGGVYLPPGAARGMELGRVVEVEVEGMNLVRNIYMVRNRKQPCTRAQTEFWQTIKTRTTRGFNVPGELDFCQGLSTTTICNLLIFPFHVSEKLPPV